MDEITDYLNESPTIFFIYRKKNNWKLEYVTNNVKKLFGFSAEDILLDLVDYRKSIHPDDTLKFKEESKKLLLDKKDEHTFAPYRVIRNNKISWVSQISKLKRNKDGEVNKIYGYLTDITKEFENKKNLESYINIVNENVLISISDEKGVIVDCSEALCKASGYSKEELIGQNHNLLRHKDNNNAMYQELWATISQGQVWHGEHKNLGKDGKIFWVENSITPSYDYTENRIKYTSVCTDITHKKEISQLLSTDYLTKIFNRRHFHEIFDLELKRAKRHKYSFIFMIIDIDYFKQYNDTYGHHEGDKALIYTAKTLKNTLKRPEDYCFRLGGEEFGIITSNVNLEGALILANKLVKKIELLQIEHKNSQVSKNLTVSLGLKHIQNAEEVEYNQIYKDADEALYKAKAQGRNRVITS